jgi:hypothetical protein
MRDGTCTPLAASACATNTGAPNIYLKPNPTAPAPIKQQSAILLRVLSSTSEKQKAHRAKRTCTQHTAQKHETRTKRRTRRRESATQRTTAQHLMAGPRPRKIEASTDADCHRTAPSAFAIIYSGNSKQREHPRGRLLDHTSARALASTKATSNPHSNPQGLFSPARVKQSVQTRAPYQEQVCSVCVQIKPSGACTGCNTNDRKAGKKEFMVRPIRRNSW